MNDNLLKGLDKYIKDNQIDIITLTSYKRNIFARLFNPSIARKMILILIRHCLLLTDDEKERK